MSRPHSEAIPAAIQANGFAPDEPAVRTVDVEAFVHGQRAESKYDPLRVLNRINCVFFTWCREHHVQEITRV